ncbi:AraC family transcriptional regulator [Cohnella herbarum]|uniref:Helix-turn-helix transcriptional regulator n=1 Tax=Cohnella herbarum TaxID=2728023 RepID=A0A7Z2VPQ2_9BACL|nr:AraC family transcriptional regulator [Cohnella herbarum]QJD86949.1 helix-turn-helix transcriptional regulator [Cohnella herbarum]
MADLENQWPFIHTVGDVWAQAGSILGTRNIPDYELVYFPEGTASVYEVEVGGLSISLDKPCFVFTRPGENHRYVFDPARKVRHLFIHFDYECLRENDIRFGTLLRDTHRLLVSSHSLLPSLMKQMLRIANFQSPYWRRRLSALLAAALEELCASADNALEELANPLPIPIARAIAYMEAHLEEPVTIEEIARQSGWSHEHFTRMFAASVGISPKRALLERRLIRAEQLMMSGQWTVKQIAFRVGFGDEHHFSKMYKRIRGMPPTAYIERCESSLFRHATAVHDQETPYPANRHIFVNEYIK